MVVIHSLPLYASAFYTVSHFIPTLFTGMAEAYLQGTSLKFYTQNIRLECVCLIRANTLAYYGTELITTVKSFKVQAPVGVSVGS